jgi:hypothetical protein
MEMEVEVEVGMEIPQHGPPHLMKMEIEVETETGMENLRKMNMEMKI